MKSLIKIGDRVRWKSKQTGSFHVSKVKDIGARAGTVFVDFKPTRMLVPLEPGECEVVR